MRLARLRTVTQEDDVGCQDLEQAMQIARFDRPLERLERVSDLGHGSLQVASHIPNIGRSGRYQSGIIGPMAMTVRTDPEMEKALTALTEAEGASRQEIIRRAVLDRYERRGHLARVEASSDRMLKRWGDVLERLGRA